MSDAATHGLAFWNPILDTARHAPSPHNVQPWRVRLTSSYEAKLFIDGARTLPNEDTTGSFLLSAMAMFMEAVNLLAAQYALRLEWHLHRSATDLAATVSRPTPPDLIPFAALRLVPAPDARVTYAPKTFLARRTSRVSLHPIPVPGAVVAELAKLATAWGHTYTHLSGPQDLEAIVHRNIEAVFHDMNLAHYHDELTSWFRYTKRASDGHRDGLDWRSMNLSRAEFWLSAKFPQVLRFAPARAAFRRRYRKQLGHVPAIGILSGDFFNPENAIESGRFLLHFWLELARLGLYLHPYGNLVTNPDAAAWLETRTHVPRAWFVFKIGYSDEPPPSQRRALADILVPPDAGQVP